MEAITPAAVGPDESPLPPADSGRHSARVVPRPMVIMSCGVDPMSGPVE
jgi:hypothetical protein